MPGPMRKRDAERRRRNKDGVDTLTVDLDVQIAGTIEIPAPDPDWHPVVAHWYDSLTRSGQAVFYEPSDWATALVLAEALDRELKPQQVRVGTIKHEDGSQDYVFEDKLMTISGASLNAILSGMSQLMTTEGSRRKLRVELERKRHRDGMVEGNSDVVPISKKRNERFAASQQTS